MDRVGAAVKSNAVDTNAAGGLGSATRIDNSYILGSTTLGVRDGGTALGAGRGLLANGSIRHAIMEVEVAVKLRRDLERINREVRDTAVGAAAKARAARAIRRCNTSDAFGLCSDQYTESCNRLGNVPGTDSHQDHACRARRSRHSSSYRSRSRHTAGRGL